MTDQTPFDFKAAQKAVEDVGRAFEEFKETHTKLSKDRDAVLDAKLAKIEADIAANQKIADEAVLAIKRAQRVVTDEDGNVVDVEQKARDWAGIISKETKFSGDFGAEQLGEYKKAFISLARKNFRSDLLTDAERKALSVGTDSAGGYFVHPDMSGRIVAKIYETSAVRAYASVQVISTDVLEGYYDNDEVGYGWVHEMGSRTETTTPGLGMWSIPVHEMYAMPKASQKLLDDAAIDMESWLTGKISDRFLRAENAAFVSGNGVGKPRGWLDYADGTDLTNSVERHNTGADGAFASAPNGGDVLISALYDLKAPYRNNATWFMNSSVFAMVRKLKDSDGAYLWQPGIQVGQPPTILGRPTATFEDMPTPAASVAGTIGITVGDLRSAYQVVDRMGIRMLRDPYTSKGQVLFYATKRTGGDLINGEAIKNIEFSAS